MYPNDLPLNFFHHNERFLMFVLKENIFKEGELEEVSVVKEYLTTASDGKNYFSCRASIFGYD